MTELAASPRGFSAFRVAFTLVALAFVVFLVWTQRHGLHAWLLSLHLGWAAAAFLLLCLSNAVAALLFAHMLASRIEFGKPSVNFAAAFLLGQLGKYLPGRIWGIAQQVSLLRSSAAAAIVIVINLELLILLLGASIAVGAVMICFAKGGFEAGLIILVLALLAVVFLPSRISWLLTAVRFIIVRLPRRFEINSTLENRGKPSQRQLWKFRFLLVGFCISFALGWFLLFFGAIGLDPDESAEITGVLALSAIIGMLSMLPGGLGAREFGVLAFGSWLGLDSEVLASSAIASRAMIILIDLLLAGAAIPFLSRLGMEKSNG